MGRQAVEQLRAAMAAHGIDAYWVVTDDFHGSEYVGNHFKARVYLTGFTGSAGSAVVTADRALLWTDGRYFLQAAAQLEGSGIELMKMGEKDVPTVEAWLRQTLRPGQTLGFDGRTVSARQTDRLAEALAKNGVKTVVDLDLMEEIWPQRPPISQAPACLLDVRYAGRSRAQKLADIRLDLSREQADCLLLSTLDDIMWLLNIRGGDVAYNPVLLSYLLLEADRCTLFASPRAFSPADAAVLAQDGVTLALYDQVYESVAALEGKTVWADTQRINGTLLHRLPSSAKLLDKTNPTLLPKAIKNPVETKNIQEAHRRDGVAVTKFLYWLKHQAVAEGATELSAAEKLETFRQEGEHYWGQSFDPIIAYAHHGAIVHYSATPQTDILLQAQGLVLCDTGGHYSEGSTDITRTVSLGELTIAQREDYTDVLRGHLRLGAAVFKHGVRGVNLDYLAREPLWARGLDYQHGTGHGVGYLLNIHEGPNSFRWQLSDGPCTSAVLEPGMVTSDEPGLYREGQYGIRIENLLLCCPAQETADGVFLRFEHLTLVPYDRAAILPERLTAQEKQWLNAYHQAVYETVACQLSEEEAAWLRAETAPFI